MEQERFAEGRYGQIMPQDEFYGLIQICDAFELVMLEREFAAGVKKKLEKQKLFYRGTAGGFR